MQQYRPMLLKDKHVGALRMLIELQLKQRIKKVQTIVRGALQTVQTWVWWDELLLAESQRDPHKILSNIEQNFVLNQQQQQERLALEAIDRDAITKMVNSVAGLACARATSARKSLISSDVLKSLQDLVEVSTISALATVAPAESGRIADHSCICIWPHLQRLRARVIGEHRTFLLGVSTLATVLPTDPWLIL